jgi:hypothetical protein
MLLEQGTATAIKEGIQIHHLLSNPPFALAIEIAKASELRDLNLELLTILSK